MVMNETRTLPAYYDYRRIIATRGRPLICPEAYASGQSTGSRKHPYQFRLGILCSARSLMVSDRALGSRHSQQSPRLKCQGDCGDLPANRDFPCVVVRSGFSRLFLIPTWLSFLLEQALKRLAESVLILSPCPLRIRTVGLSKRNDLLPVTIGISMPQWPRQHLQ